MSDWLYGVILLGTPILLCVIAALIACWLAWRNADRSRPLFQFSLAELLTFILLLTPGLALTGQWERPAFGVFVVCFLGFGALVGWFRSRARRHESDSPWKPILVMATWSLGFTIAMSLVTYLWVYVYIIVFLAPLD